MSKGDKCRIDDKKRFDDNYDKIRWGEKSEIQRLVDERQTAIIIEMNNEIRKFIDELE